MPTISAGQAVVQVLKAEGVKCVFGLPGGHTLGFYDALYETPEIRHILVRHEQTAANMAGAYAILTGEAGICSATAGPGATNLVTGIAEAFAGSLPVIAITGRAVTRCARRGACQEIAQERLFAPITKWAVRVDRADTVVETMRHAFTVARSGRPGPVLVDLPMDIQMQPVEFDRYIPVGRPPALRPDPRQVKTAVERLLKSERPIVIAGGGAMASNAFDELIEFAETLAIPVLTTLSGRGAFPESHLLAFGGMGLHRNDVSKKLLNEADFLLSLGCRYEEMDTAWVPSFLPAPDACYVQVEIDPCEMGRTIVPQIAIAGDITMVLKDMMEAVREKGGPDHRATFSSLPRIKELIQLKERMETALEASAASSEKPLNVLRVVREVQNAFPKKTTWGIDIGFLTQGWPGTFPHLKVDSPRSLAAATNFYAMGFIASGIPAARLVYPDRPAVAFCGDGSFQMIMNILPVAVEHNLPVTWCILNNRSLGSIKEIQEGAFCGRIIGTAFEVQPNFALIAEACCCYGEQVEDPALIGSAVTRALEANNRGIPAVLDFIVSGDRPKATHEFLAGMMG